MLDLFESSVSAQHWRKAKFEETEEVVRFDQEVIMAADESPYMEELAAKIAGPHVLEVGFGMGISARQLLQNANVLHHVVLEPNEHLFGNAVDLAAKSSHNVTSSPMLGFWEELTPLLRNDSFDGILYDVFPGVANIAFLREARRLLRPGGMLGFYFSTCAHGEEDVDYCIGWDDKVPELLEAGWLPEELLPGKTVSLNIRSPCPEDFKDCPLVAREFFVPDIRKTTEGCEVTLPPEAKRESVSRWWQQAVPIECNGGDALCIRNQKTGLAHVVMDTEEAEYMKDLAQLAFRGHGSVRVLEVGYGMGILFELVQQTGVQQHVIVEANANVMRRMKLNLGNRSHVRAIFGFWQEVLPLLETASFDVILFDAFPMADELNEASNQVVFHLPFMEHAYRLLKEGGTFSYMSGACDATSIHRDRAAGEAAGFQQFILEPRPYKMLDHCTEYPDCPTEHIDLLLTSLVKDSKLGAAKT